MNTDNHHFIVKTNKDVDAWMDGFYVGGHKSDFRLHCQWAWQEQERRHNAVESDLLEAMTRLVGWAEIQYGAATCAYSGDHPIAMAVHAIARAKGEI